MHFIDLAEAQAGVIDFTSAGSDMKGRFLYRHSGSVFEWNIASRITAKKDISRRWAICRWAICKC